MPSAFVRVVLATVAVWFCVASTSAQAPAAGTDHRSILVSRQLAERAHLSVGDVVTLGSDPTGTRRADFRIAGIYEPTPDPMRFTAARIEARMHLPDLVDLVSPPADAASRETATAINVRLVDPADRTAFASDVMARAPGIAARSTSRTRDDDPFAVLDRFHVAISAVTMVGGTAFLLALMVIRAEERRETIGILRLVGISRRTLLASVAVEGVMIAALGAVFGVLIAVATEGLVNRIFQARYDTALVFVRVTPSIALRAILIAAPLGVVAGVAASWTLLRRSILSIVRR
jgi:ABC-type lipoprotein release transport system permease subunit